jgi:hypothetical protein
MLYFEYAPDEIVAALNYLVPVNMLMSVSHKHVEVKLVYSGYHSTVSFRACICMFVLDTCLP